MPRQQFSEAERAAARDARGTLAASTPRTTRPGSETTRLRAGDRVRCERTFPSKGTWRYYAGKTGTVVSIHREKFPEGRGTYVEIGVSFAPVNGDTRKVEADAWFRNDELVKIRYRRAADTIPACVSAEPTPAAV